MFQTPQQLGYQFMQAPRPMNPMQQQSGPNPLQGQAMNMQAMQQAQQAQQASNPLSMMQGLMGKNPPSNPLAAPPAALSGSAANPAASNNAAMASYDQLAAGDRQGDAGAMMSSGMTSPDPSWLMRQLSGTGIGSVFGA